MTKASTGSLQFESRNQALRRLRRNLIISGGLTIGFLVVVVFLILLIA